MAGTRQVRAGQGHDHDFRSCCKHLKYRSIPARMARHGVENRKQPGYQTCMAGIGKGRICFEP